jgi:uncharacterized LabA/DUF88 family protein
MSEKIAIIIDGGFLKKKLKEKLERFPTAEDIISHCNNLLKFDALKDSKLFRYYYYDAFPFEKPISNPIDGSRIDLANTEIARLNKSLIESLELKPYFAVRKGTLTCHGWKLGREALRGFFKRTKTDIVPRDVVPDLEQKGVDLKIGLDIAWIASRRIVDAVLLITGDSDLVPAMKFARKEGIKVYLNPLGHSIRRELKVHSDLIIEAEEPTPS